MSSLHHYISTNVIDMCDKITNCAKMVFESRTKMSYLLFFVFFLFRLQINVAGNNNDIGMNDVQRDNVTSWHVFVVYINCLFMVKMSSVQFFVFFFLFCRLVIIMYLLSNEDFSILCTHFKISNRKFWSWIYNVFFFHFNRIKSPIILISKCHPKIKKKTPSHLWFYILVFRSIKCWAVIKAFLFSFKFEIGFQVSTL